MNHQQDQIPGYRDRVVFRQRWLPSGEVRAALLIVHGMAEHSGRYQRLVDYFLPQGCAIYTFDHPGHGQSQGPRCHVDSFQDLSENLQRMVQWVKAEQAGKPLILFGHSMGGLIVADFLITAEDQIDAAILSAPALKAMGKPSVLQILKVLLLKRLRPEMGFSRLDLRGLSRNPEIIRAYRADPLVHTGAMSIGLALALGQTMKKVASKAKDLTLPLLIVQGGQDTMVDPQGAESFLAAVSSPDKHLQMYPDAYHEILNEPEAEDCLDLMSEWLAARFPQLGIEAG